VARRIHDMGGMTGFEAIEVEQDEPVFHERWEGRVFGLFNLALAFGLANVDRARAAVESHERDAYLGLGYYGRWLEAAARIFEDNGLLRPGELDARAQAVREGAQPTPVDPLAIPPAPPGFSLSARRTIERAPLFHLGQSVRARDVDASGHTRLPGYVRGRRGVVVAQYGAWVFPDTHARGEGESPQHVYCVRFEGRELWGAEAEAHTATHVDLFESYLDAAPQAAGEMGTTTV